MNKPSKSSMKPTSDTTDIRARSISNLDGDRLLKGLDPVYHTDARVLVLGSLPGAQSLAQARYYAHPRNQFWHLVGAAIGADLVALDYDARLGCLIEHRIALWDVVATGHRQGSLDAALRIVERSDLAGLVGQLPKLRAIAFNGALAAKQVPRCAGTLDRLDLPSSSPANTTALRIKQVQWRQIGHYLDD